ncbi:hypothetical protein [Pseudorhodobacter sp.]|uniref:hypothetical protein n=1 Tax=Pseudorhodobacter sp. TaxID=1934400 RepID=UPI00264869C4|nr:hypothetical protein [Pseudorhodobacter sp.]MDN5787570.1 hypothetical protein [Pseudorhodobacter sp.]
MRNDETALDRLERVMQETAEALRNGNLAGMGDFTARIEAEVALLESGSDAARIKALRDLAERNAVGLAAAARGVRAARRRLTEIVSARAGGQTYDGAGRTRQIAVQDARHKTRL